MLQIRDISFENIWDGIVSQNESKLEWWNSLKPHSNVRSIPSKREKKLNQERKEKRSMFRNKGI